MSELNPNRFNKYRARDRAREVRLTKEQIMRECFSHENEFPIVLPMGHSEESYAREMMLTDKGDLEVTEQGERWIPDVRYADRERVRPSLGFERRPTSIEQLRTESIAGIIVGDDGEADYDTRSVAFGFHIEKARA